MNDSSSPDILIVGSGIGGATLAAGLAPTGANVLILERGERLADTPETRGRSFSAAYFARPRPGSTAPARRSTLATITTSAATASFTARC
jgi:choline dehydrogenase-like flavoprotein